VLKYGRVSTQKRSSARDVIQSIACFHGCFLSLFYFFVVGVVVVAAVQLTGRSCFDLMERVRK
jgi:hypothetical protein